MFLVLVVLIILKLQIVFSKAADKCRGERCSPDALPAGKTAQPSFQLKVPFGRKGIFIF